MILRRVIQHVKKQEWTAIWIDLVIVVLGVFIGIQVANWNAERADRNAERRHLEEIAEDLRADIVNFDLIQKSALRRISAADYILGETRGVSRPSGLNMPTGEKFDIPVGLPMTPAEHNILLSRVNLVRVTMGNRTGFDALIGAGGMQTIRNRQISRQLQQYYAQMDDLIGTQAMLRQIRNEGTTIGYPLGLSAFGEMDDEKLIGIVRGSPAYSAYLRTVREWAAIHLDNTVRQKQSALHLIEDINKYLGKSGGVAP
jgi:hypothetical protein